MKKAMSVLLAAATCAALAGCGGGGQDPTTTAAPAGDAAADSSDAPAASGEVTTIKLALWDYDVDGSVYPEIIAAFEAKYPDIKVEPINSSNADYETKLTTMMAGGDDIDLYFAKSNTSYPTMVLKGYAMDLNGLIQENNYDLTPYGTVLNQHYEIDGGLYALPFRTNDWVIFYNKAMFDAAGVDYPTNDMTWEQFRETALAITSGENYGAAFIPKPGFIVPMLVGAEDGFDILTSDFAALEAPMQYMLDLMNTDQSYEEYAQSVSMSQDQTYFYKGTSGMLYNGSWFTQMLTANADNVDFEWGIVKSPYWEGTTKKGFATSTPILINPKTEKLDAAWKLLTFMTGEEGAKLLAKQQLIPGYMTDEVMAIFKENTGLDDDSMAALTDNNTYALGEANALMGLVADAINSEVDLVMTDNQTPAEAVANMEARRQEIMEANQ